MSLYVTNITIHFQNNYILYSPTLYLMAITTCKVCGNAYETTEEDANIPLSCAGEKDMICNSCYLKKIWQEETLHTYCVRDE